MCCIGLTAWIMGKHWLFSTVHSCNNYVKIESDQSVELSLTLVTSYLCESSHPSEQETSWVTHCQYLITVLEIWPVLQFAIFPQAFNSYLGFAKGMILWN